MARLYKRNGKWFVDVMVQGERVRRMVGPERREAQRFLKRIISEGRVRRIFGTSKAEPKKTWDDLYQRLEIDNRGRVKESTSIRYFVSQKALSPYFGETDIKDITAMMIADYRVKRLEAGVKPATINRDLAVLRAGLNLAVRWDWIEKTPFPKVRLDREPEGKTRFLSQDELGAILDEVPSWMKGPVIVAVNTGMRLGELRGLTWNACDFQHRRITLTETKSGKRRSIPMNEAVVHAIRSEPRALGCPFVFVRDHRPLGNITNTFQRAARRLGMDDVNWHTLRHTFASYCAISGVRMTVLRELLGHSPSSFRMTLRYAHLSPEKHKEAVGLIGEMFEAATTRALPFGSPRV